MKLQMLNSFTNFLEKSVNIVLNVVAALPDHSDLNYISHSAPPQEIAPPHTVGVSTVTKQPPVQSKTKRCEIAS